MSEILKAIRYRNLDEARKVLAEILDPQTAVNVFDDDGEEPQGLLSVIPEDRLSESDFVELFGLQKGVLVEVERIPYSGFGPPAEEDDYMGYASENCAYVLKGSRLEIEILNCPFHAEDIHQLEAMVIDEEHPLNRDDLADRLKLTANWDFEELFDLLLRKTITADEIDRLIHEGLEAERRN